MRYGLLKNFATCLLIFTVRHDFPKAINSASTASLNNSDEIKNIFSHADVIKSTTDSDLKGMHQNKNFVEGGLVDVKISASTLATIKNMEQNLLNSTENVESLEIVERQNMPSLQMNVSNSKSKINLNFSTYKNLHETKLPGTGSDLFLGVPEVSHINGISSIKPRKGVNFDNIDNIVVPHKGIDGNKESFLSNFSCLWLDKNDCYYTEETQDLECSCCREGNTLAEIFKQQALVNCNKCKPMVNANQNQIAAEDKVKCKNICCKSVFHDTNPISSTTKDDFIRLRNNSKLKPTVTKVPYDVEVVAELLSKVKQKVFLPVVISLLLLPLVGISIFFIWQRMKEYWDKRFYKRMDFLIDGIYND